MGQLWIINHYAQSPQQSAAAWHYTLAEYLTANGMPTLLIAASTELNSNRQTLNAGETQRREGNFLRLYAPSYKGNGLSRLRNMLAFTWRVLTVKAERPDIVLASSPQPFACMAAWWRAKMFKVPFVFEIRDLWPESLIELGHIRKDHPLSKILSWMETWLIRRANLVVTVLPGVVEHVKARGAKDAAWIPNGVDMRQWPETTPANELFTLMYFGAHGTAQGLPVLIDAMRRLKSEPIRLRLIGDGPQKAALVQSAKDLPNVRFEDAVAQAQLPAIAAQADAFVLHLMPAPAFATYGISPNKLYDYMAAGRPVVFACAALNDPVKDAGAGLSIPPVDAAAMAEAIRRLAAMSAAERHAMGMRARSYATAHFDVSSLGNSLANRLKILT